MDTPYEKIDIEHDEFKFCLLLLYGEVFEVTMTQLLPKESLVKHIEFAKPPTVGSWLLDSLIDNLSVDILSCVCRNTRKLYPKEGTVENYERATVKADRIISITAQEIADRLSKHEIGSE